MNIQHWCEVPMWILFYSICVIPFTSGTRLKWDVNTFFAVLCLTLVLIYSFGSLPFVNFSQNASLHKNKTFSHSSNWFHGGLYNFFYILPTTTWSYKGLQTITFTACGARNPKITLPIAMVFSVLTLFITNILIVFVSSSVPPGVGMLMKSKFPLNVGYTEIFNVSTKVACLFTMPAQVAKAFGFCLPYGKLLRACANSNLVPGFLGLKGNETIQRSVMIASVLCFAFCILGFYYYYFSYYYLFIIIINIFSYYYYL